MSKKAKKRADAAEADYVAGREPDGILQGAPIVLELFRRDGVDWIAPAGARHPAPGEPIGQQWTRAVPPEAPEVVKLPEHDRGMPHRARYLMSNPDGVEGCPPRCPRRVAVDAAPPVLAKVVETPQQCATRLDREREDARRAYSAAIYAADEAWRAIGGRP